MAEHILRIRTVDCTFENGVSLRWPLYFREVSALGRDAKKLSSVLTSGAAKILKQAPLLDHHRRRDIVEPELRRFTLVIEPTAENRSWSSPIELPLTYLYWSHSSAHLAYVPMLDIEVSFRNEAGLEQQVEREARFALQRERAIHSLPELHWFWRYQNVALSELQLSYYTPTPREAEEEKEKRDPQATLKAVAQRLDTTPLPPSFENSALVHQIAEAITSKQPSSVLLVGPSGVGKTAAVHNLVRDRLKLGLAGRTFWSTSGAKIVSGMTGYGMWQERCQLLAEEAKSNDVILHLGNLHELMEVGKYEGNDQGVADFLRPRIQRGDLLSVAECTAEQLSLIEQNSPNLLSAFLVLHVAEPDAAKNQIILRKAFDDRARSKHTISDEAIAVIDRLHRRYATYSASPGRPLRFLRNLLEDCETERIGEREITDQFSRETGLPLQLLDPAAPLDLEDLRTRFGNRLIGQRQAIDLVVDLLAVIKSGLTRPQRPIASLLFIGPTGVGKTEMAKTLAEFLYQDSSRMTRIDMSEFSDPLAVDRLIGGNHLGEGILTAKVRESPFGVVLLDEFEKAHPRLHDVLLQVLGEGRLTDAAGRLADFCNSVIIMTSNLGVETHREGGVGFGGGDTGGLEGASITESLNVNATREHFLKEVRNFVRPEFFNRIDRIVPFDPLSQEEIAKIGQRELSLLQQRDGVKYRNFQLEISDEVAGKLAAMSHDARYGARPLKRAMERKLLTPLANQLNQFSDTVPLTATVTWEADRPKIKVRQTQAGSDVSLSSGAVIELANQAAVLRREADRMSECHAVVEIRNRIFRLKKLEKRWLSGKNGFDHRTAAASQKLASLRAKLQSVERVCRDVAELEEDLLVTCYQDQPVDLKTVATEMSIVSESHEAMLLQLFSESLPQNSRINLFAFSEQPNALNQLCGAYREVARQRHVNVKEYELFAVSEDDREKFLLSEDRMVDGHFLLGLEPEWEPLDLKHFKGTLLKGKQLERRKPDQSYTRSALGAVLSMEGPLASALWSDEGGLHQFEKNSNFRERVLVNLSWEAPQNFIPPERIDRRGAIPTKNPQRVYNFSEEFIFNGKEKHRFEPDDFSSALGELMRAVLVKRAKVHLGLVDEADGNC